jgi:hypothetical protein
MEMETGIWGNIHLLFPARLDRRRKKRGELSYSALPFDTFCTPPDVFIIDTIYRQIWWLVVLFGNGGWNC